MIFIDGVQVVNNDFYQGATERSGIVNLAAGYHDITILFCEATGGAGVTASYTPFGGSKQLIPNSVLYNTPGSGASGFCFGQSGQRHGEFYAGPVRWQRPLQSQPGRH